MDVITILQDPPSLRRPVLIAAFEGWNDAGEAASMAAAVLRRETDGTLFAEIDAEEFYDFQLVRPRVRVDDGGSRRIDWPENRFFWSLLPGADRHLLTLEGTEPSLRWRAFTTAIVDLARGQGVELVVTLGALQIDAPHTRPVPVTGSTSHRHLVEQFGLRRSSYEGPTGITGVLHHACATAGLDAVSLWAGIPHYLAGASYLPGALALAERASRLVGAQVPLDELARDAAEQREDIAEFVDEDEELAEYVTELEERYETDNDVAVEELPATSVTGEEIAAEFERFLRDREG